MPKATISRAGTFLAEAGLAQIKTDRTDKRRRRLYLTKEGQQRLEEIELDISKLVMLSVGAEDADSSRLWHFAKHVWKLNCLLPESRLTNPDTYFSSQIPLTGRVDPNGREGNLRIVIGLRPSALPEQFSVLKSSGLD